MFEVSLKNIAKALFVLFYISYILVGYVVAGQTKVGFCSHVMWDYVIGSSVIYTIYGIAYSSMLFYNFFMKTAFNLTEALNYSFLFNSLSVAFTTCILLWGFSSVTEDVCFGGTDLKRVATGGVVMQLIHLVIQLFTTWESFRNGSEKVFTYVLKRGKCSSGSAEATGYSSSTPPIPPVAEVPSATANTFTTSSETNKEPSEGSSV